MAAGGCKVCGEPVSAKGWCGMHYMRWRRTGDPLTPPQRVRGRTCSITGCTRAHEAKGLCRLHYQRANPPVRSTRLVEVPQPRETPAERKARLDALWEEIRQRRNSA